MSASLTIRTPEGVAFRHQLAGPIARCLAWLIDLVCILLLLIVAGVGIQQLSVLSADLTTAFVILASLVITIGYTMFLEWFWRGQTIGKRILRLRVIDQNGLRLQPSQVVVRNLLRPVDALPVLYAVGGLSALLTANAQRLGDIAAGTVVIRMPKIEEPDLQQIDPGKFNSFRDHPHLAARLRQRISPQEAAIYLQALVRRRELEPAARVALFERLAKRLAEEVRFPDEAVESLTAEQYVRNAVDVLYRSRIDPIEKRSEAEATSSA